MEKLRTTSDLTEDEDTRKISMRGILLLLKKKKRKRKRER